MDRLVKEHTNSQSVDEWFLIITLYASGLTGDENEFCKQYLRHKYRVEGELRSKLRSRQWIRTMNKLPKEGTMEKETVLGGRVVGINLLKVRGAVVDNPDSAVVSIKGKGECTLNGGAVILSVGLELVVPVKYAKDFFAGQLVEVVLRPK